MTATGEPDWLPRTVKEMEDLITEAVRPCDSCGRVRLCLQVRLIGGGVAVLCADHLSRVVRLQKELERAHLSLIIEYAVKAERELQDREFERMEEALES